MKYTNKYNIQSKSIRDALIGDDYDLNDRPKNVFSCTEIIDSPKVQLLRRRHHKEIEVDISDNFFVLDGSAVHYAVERSNKIKGAERLSEERIFIEITNIPSLSPVARTLAKGEKIVNASWYNPERIYVAVKFDNYEADEGVIEDYKRCSAWEAVFGLKESREQQLNIGAYALRLLGFPCNKLRACLLLKDWSRKELQNAQNRKSYYPPIPYEEFDVPVWTNKFAYSYIIERLMLHVTAQSLNDDDIPECKPDERWYRGESLAVMKDGVKTAKRVFKLERGNREEIAKIAQTCLEIMQRDDPKNAAKYKIVKRPGIDARCSDYCSAKKFCHYWKNVYSVRTETIEEEV